MANYCATARSNYFAVKDETAFREWAAHLGLTVLEPDRRNAPANSILRFGIASGSDGDCGSWPDSTYDEEENENKQIDLTGQLADHLADDEVAVLLEVGNENLRYVGGTAIAVNNRGETVFIDLDGIYHAAQTLGRNITRAEY